MLSIYRSDLSHALTHDTIEVLSDLSYKEEPIEILDRAVRVLRNNAVPLVKLLWRNYVIEETTWETEKAMQK